MLSSGNAIGDFNMVDNRFGMIIERDSGEGNPRLACSRGFNNATCFENPARLKRVYLVDLEVPAGAAVKKVSKQVALHAARWRQAAARPN